MSLATRVVSTELRKILAYRSDFWVNFLGQALVQLFIARALWEAIFLANDVKEMQGMTLPQLTLYYLLTPLTMKILMARTSGSSRARSTKGDSTGIWCGPSRH